MRHSRALSVAVLAAVLTLSACSSGEDGDDAGGGTSADVAAREGPVPASEAFGENERGTQNGADSLDLRTNPDTGAQEPIEKAVISKGDVQLHSEDVEKAAFDVQALVDEYGGQVTDSETGTDDDGEVRLARMVVRIPSKRFDAAFTDLEKVANLKSSTSTSEDVTTKVIDNAVRIRAQRRSLRRVEILLDQAQSIRDIVSIEAQLTRRQANLDSLEQQQAYLRDQASLSTITVNIQRTPDEQKKQEEKDDAGFLSGLEAGWNALVVFGTGLATLAGALLPWAVLLLVLGGPLSLLLRRLRRRTPTPAAPEPTDA